MKTHALLALAAILLMAMACDRADDERCEELDEILDAKAAQLPRACEEDIDCLLVEIHPSLTAAANNNPEDDEIAQIRNRRVELCGDFDDDRTVYQPVCVEDVCLADIAGVEPPVDVGVPDSGNPDMPPPDTGVCSCATDADCNFTDLCVDGCTCEPLCDLACENAGACNALEELRLGSDVPNCIARCDAFIERDGQAAVPLLTCLQASACGVITNCL